MQSSSFKNLLIRQQEFFATGATRPIEFRIQQLKRLHALLKDNEKLLTDALKKDLHKTAMESVITEIYTVTEDINYIVKNIKKWSQPIKVRSPLPILWPGLSQIYHEPYGVAFIMAPWNYPCQLALAPLVGAISAGNCALVKPSELTPHTQEVLSQLINKYFPPEFIVAIKAGPEETTALLEEKFDYIFFTGSPKIGKLVMQAAAKHLTPLTLELGGKSPCIVDATTSNLEHAAERIVWGKFINAGQTCIAPDYLYLHAAIKDEFIAKCIQVIKNFYGENPQLSESYGRIINPQHFERITALLSGGKVIFGGQSNAEQLYIAPTLMSDVSWNDPVMQEEIFGPVLPILTYRNMSEVIAAVNVRPKPLALYLFTKDKTIEQSVLNQVSFGGGCINDCIVHVSNCHMPFGGVGNSGLGKYHGKASFETFSHAKSIYKKNHTMGLSVMYPPYTSRKFAKLRFLLKLLQLLG